MWLAGASNVCCIALLFVAVVSAMASDESEQIPMNATSQRKPLMKSSELENSRRGFGVADVPPGSSVILVNYILKPAAENEGIAAGIGMGVGLLAFVTYLACTRYCCQNVGSERSTKWFKVPKHQFHHDEYHGGFGGPGSLAGSVAHLNGLGTLTGGDPSAEQQLRILLANMVSASNAGSPRSAASPVSHFSPQAMGGAANNNNNSNNNNSFITAAVHSGSFSTPSPPPPPPPPPSSPPPPVATMAAAGRTVSGGGAVTPRPSILLPSNINSSAPPPVGDSPPQAPPR